MSMLDTFLWPTVVGLLGVLAHILKRAQVNGEGFAALTKYLHGHFITVVLTLIGFVVSMGIAHSTETLNLYTAFLSGYLANSAFDKAKSIGGIKFPKV